EPERIPKFKRAQLVAVAPAHRPIDFNDPIRNLADHLRRVQKHILQHVPQKRPSAVLTAGQFSHALAEVGNQPSRVNGFKSGLAEHVIFERVPVDCVDLLIRSDAFIESLPALLADPTLFDHGLQEWRNHKPLAPGVTRHSVIQILSYERPDVETDDVEQAE